MSMASLLDCGGAIFMSSLELRKYITQAENYILRHGVDEDVINAYFEASKMAFFTEKDISYGLVLSGETKKLLNDFVSKQTQGDIWALERYQQDYNTDPYKYITTYYECLKNESRHKFESFMLYMEKNRPYKERFYQPRELPLKRVAQGIQDLADDILDEIFVNCPSRVGKTQIVKMGYLWFGSKNTELSNLYTAFSDKITSGFYDGMNELITDPTYTYSELFPDNVKKRPITDGKDYTIDLVRKKTYPTFTMRSIYGTLNGACDCSGLAVADDLFSGIDEAMSEDRQFTVWTKFDNNFMKRLKRKAKLINMGTRWAVKDVQGRRKELLESNEKYKNRRWTGIIIPALNENDESNFDYPYDLGYSTEDYHMVRASFEENDDIASWLAQCQQEPIERLGALFTLDNMQFYDPDTEFPEGVPDRIFAANDPAYGGGDFVSMPICYQFQNDYYVPDAVYNDGDKEVTIPEVTRRMMEHLDFFPRKTAEVHFEETKTTSAYREKCEEIWRNNGYAINTTHHSAPTNIAKVDRIKNHAPDIRKLYFVKISKQNKEYRKFFQNILSFKTEGKNKHDDGIDSVAQLCDMIYGNKRAATVEAVKNPFRTGGYHGGH